MPKRSSDKRPVLAAPPSKRLSRTSSQAPASVERPELGVTASSSTTKVSTNQRRPQLRPRRRTAASTSQTSTASAPLGGPVASCDSSASTGDPAPSIINTGNDGPKCFRIANVPEKWSEKILLTALREVDPFLESQNPQISLYPCIDSSQTKTALLNLGTSTEYFQVSKHPNHDLRVQQRLAKNDKKLSNYRRNFIEQLEIARASAKPRGILVLQSLVEANRNPDHESILSATQRIFFFGTPHQGLRTEELEAAVDAESDGQRNNLLIQLREGSEFLDTQKEDLIRIWDGFKGKLISFYETATTKSIMRSRVESDDIVTFKRNGPKVQMVKALSAQLYLKFESRIPVYKNHSDMVKFDSPVDSTYQTVVRHIREFIAQLATFSLSETFCSENVNLEQFLQALSAIDQQQHIDTLLPRRLDHDHPKYYWIFQNMDFKQWTSASSQVLWLSGPSECHLEHVSWHLSNLAKKQEAQKARSLVLYFFCSTLSGKRSISSTAEFVHTLLAQIIRSLPPPDGISVINVFLNILLKEISRKEPSSTRRLPPMPTLEEIIKESSGNELLEALSIAIGGEENLRLYIAIDGLERVNSLGVEFVKGVRSFITYLQGIHNVKVLLTSHPGDDIKSALEGVLSIEYDKERKVIHAEYLNYLRFDNTRYSKISMEHEGSLHWLWTHKEYQKWSTSDRSCLLCISGKPGSGKSTLMKYFKSNVLQRVPNARNATALASFFYSYREGESQRNHCNMLRSILYDILEQNESFFYHFQHEFRSSDSGGVGGFSYDSLKKILRSIGKRHGKERLYLLIDAVDESNDDDRRDILRLLFELCSDSKNSSNHCIIKVFIASRPVLELERLLRKSQAFITMQEVNKLDIQNYVHSFLGPTGELELPQDVLQPVKQYILEHAQGVFLWVYLIKCQLFKYVEKGYSKREMV
ncbi:hypothetical protein K440DRAFT_643546 [Wilcoxina mikolae CBS 423.85]|nr:hypothetical protein K440DRAFT_643546 [Wilcoxina mikolae CBS 423.85]